VKSVAVLQAGGEQHTLHAHCGDPTRGEHHRAEAHQSHAEGKSEPREGKNTSGISIQQERIFLRIFLRVYKTSEV
jgi:hypothetical protein